MASLLRLIMQINNDSFVRFQSNIQISSHNTEDLVSTFITSDQSQLQINISTQLIPSLSVQALTSNPIFLKSYILYKYKVGSLLYFVILFYHIIGTIIPAYCHQFIRNQITNNIIRLKQNKIMKNSKRKDGPGPKKERYEVAVQSSPVNSEAEEGPFMNSRKQLVSKSTALPDGFNSSLKFQNMQSLIGKISLAEKSSKAEIDKRKKEIPKGNMRRAINVNVMKLQDKHFQIDKNIYNIALGQLDSKEAYLSSLNEEINELKNKIQALEEEQNEKIMNRSIDHQIFWSEKHNQERSRTIDNRKTQCGRFYSKLATPQSGRKSMKFKGKQEESTFFKWRPQIQQRQVSDLGLNSKQILKGSNQKKNPEQKNRINYRFKRPIKQPSLPEQNHGVNPLNTFAQTQKLIRIESLEQPTDSKGEPEKQIYQNIEIFKEDEPSWQINSIADDFRDKMQRKLQIPLGFPLESLSPMLPLHQYQKLSSGLYDIFGVNLQKSKQKVIVRKFKNGVYYQLPPNKNIIWYFNGSFYLGNWETDLPTEGQKNGFGFQYIPNKYVYLGHFKNGLRQGKGVMKIFPKHQEKQSEFTGYDGEWFNGKPDGFGKHIDQNNTKYIGTFTAGEKTGKAIILTKDGLRYEGEVIKGIKQGLGLQKLVNGDYYTGEFSDGKFHGKGVYKWKNGSSYDGQFIKGKRQGNGAWKSSNGDSFEGQYINDAKHGWGQFKWANGQIYEGQFRNDVRHGEGTYKHPSGKQGKFLWKDGQIDHRIPFQEMQQPRVDQKKEEQASI